MRQIFYILFLTIAALMMSCTGSDGPKDETGLSQDATFDHAMGVADSLFSCMQFRDAYKLYLQLLDNEEVEADSEKKLSVLNSLCNTSELSGHKAEQHKWLQQLLDLAEQTGNDYYQSLAHITMGQNIFYEGDREKGICDVNRGIDLMAKTNRENTDHMIHGYLNMLASMYGAMKDYDHAQQTIMQQQAENTRQRYLLFGALIVLVGVMIFAVIVLRKNRIISRKNQSLAAEITEAITYKEKYIQEKLKFDEPASTSDIMDLDTLSDEQLFQYINDVIVRERLFLNQNFDRQTIMDRFQLTKERVGAVTILKRQKKWKEMFRKSRKFSIFTAEI